jgi:hypothetical protein
MPTIDDYVPARRYLAPKNASLWRWDSSGPEAIVWAEGGTIVFRDELLPVVTRLSRRGLPPMNALVWLLAACRSGWPAASRNILAKLGALVAVERGEIPGWLPQLLTQLDAVHTLPDDLRTPEAKAELAMLAFEGSRPHVVQADAFRVARMLVEQYSPRMVEALGGPPGDIRDVLADLRLLHEGLKKFDPETFRLRYRTGLEHSIVPAEIELEPAEEARQLIARLQEDEELGGVARIARCLLAAIQLPRAISDEEDVPVGGVSDIANHGPLDRLMLSELANDGLTLAVRVAMNEALYLRRETPPGNPPRHRAVLLDSGVRLWGVPRVFSTAVGMALAAGGQNNVRTDFFRASAGQVAPVALTNRAGLVSHLECLEAEAHPGASLERFTAAALTESGLLDAVIVTGEDVAADREFQRAVAAMEVPTVLLATVSRAGRFRLVSHGKRGRKLLREATLDLDRLLTPPIKPKPHSPAPLIDKSVPDALPAIFSVQPFPLLQSYQPVIASRTWTAPWGGLLSISDYRCLFHWSSRDRGARLLSDKMPGGAIQWTGATSDGTVSLAVIGALQQANLRLLRIDSANGTCKTLPIDCRDGRPVVVFGHAGVIFIIYSNRVDIFEIDSSSRVNTVPMPEGMAWKRDRFFARWSEFSGRNDEWYALSHDGFKPVFERLVAKSLPGPGCDFLTFLEGTGVDTPIGITEQGGIYRSGENVFEGPPIELERPLRIEAVAPGGRALVLSDAKRWNFREISLDNLAPKQVGRDSGTWFSDTEKVWRTFVQTKEVRNRFISIFIDRQGQLGLVAKRRSEAIITLMEDEKIVLVNRTAESPDKRAVATFSPVPGPPGVGYSLHMARWPDGSRAWLDSRGMLHLKSSNQDVPELTLILRDGWLAGWFAGGQTFGMDYFSDTEKNETDRSDPEKKDLEHHVYYNVLQAFLAELT